MVGNVPKEKSVFSELLIRTSVVLQGMGVVLLVCGTIVVCISLIQKVDRLNWIALLLFAASLSANLGMACLFLACRKRPGENVSAGIQLPACAEPGFRRSTPAAPAAVRSLPSELASTLFSDLQNQPRTQ